MKSVTNRNIERTGSSFFQLKTSTAQRVLNELSA